MAVARWISFFLAAALLGFMSVTDARLLADAPLGVRDPQLIVTTYSEATITNFFGALGDEGRPAWRAMVVYVDSCFIAAFGLWAVLAAFWQIGRRRALAIAAAVAFMVLDLTENMTLLAMLDPWLLPGWVLYPPIGQTPLWVSFVTILKFTAVAVVLLLAFVAWWGRRNQKMVTR